MDPGAKTWATQALGELLFSLLYTCLLKTLLKNLSFIYKVWIFANLALMDAVS